MNVIASAGATGNGARDVNRGASRRPVIVLLCAACAFISIADRSSLSVLVLDMKAELGWSSGEEAKIMASFYYGQYLNRLHQAQDHQNYQHDTKTWEKLNE